MKLLEFVLTSKTWPIPISDERPTRPCECCSIRTVGPVRGGLSWADSGSVITSLLHQSLHLHRHSLPFPRQWTGPLTFHLKCITRCVGCAVCVGPLVRWSAAHLHTAVWRDGRVGAKCTQFWANVRLKLCLRSLIAWKTHFWARLCACEHQRDHLKWGLQILYQQNLVDWRCLGTRHSKRKNKTQLKCSCGKTQIILKHSCVSPPSLYFLCACLPAANTWIQATVLTLDIFHIL